MFVFLIFVALYLSFWGWNDSDPSKLAKMEIIIFSPSPLHFSSPFWLTATTFSLSTRDHLWLFSILAFWMLSNTSTFLSIRVLNCALSLLSYLLELGKKGKNEHILYLALIIFLFEYCNYLAGGGGERRAILNLFFLSINLVLFCFRLLFLSCWI